MTSNKKMARQAGILYLMLVVTGVFSLIYVPSKLIVRDDAATTLNNLLASETLFRFGVVIGLISVLIYLFLALALYKLLNQVNKNHALVMVILVIVCVPLSFVTILNEFTVLSLIADVDSNDISETEQLQSQVMFYLERYRQGNFVAQIFLGLWLLPFGYLVFKSGFLPKILGIFLMLGCFGYLTDFFGGFFFPNYGDTIIPTIAGIPSSIGEIGICLWLLIIGAKNGQNN